MRQWLAMIAVIALLLYVGSVLDHNQPQADRPVGPRIAALEQAMARAGGSLEAARFRLVAPISDPAAPTKVRAALGWDGAVPVGESREARLHTEAGMYYLALDWRMTGEPASRWVEHHAALSKVLGDMGIATPIHVEIEGMSSRPAEDLLATAHAALDGVDAATRQPWTGERSASVAGRSVYLPAGPHEVNVQVATRSMEQGVRLWIAWPALTGDY